MRRPPRRVGKENTTSVPVETGAYDVPPSGWRRLTKTLPPAVFNCTQPSLLSLRPLDPCRFGSGRRDATLRRVRRTVLFAAAACVALVGPLVSGATSRSVSAKPAARREISPHITLRLRYKTGPWVTNLSVKLPKYQLETYKVCGVWNWPDE